MAVEARADKAMQAQISTVHATTIAIGEAGILIRGASGAGKTTLALALIAYARQAGRFARLVADDRTALAAAGSRLLARPVAPLEGIVERCGLGLTPEPYLPAAVVRFVIDLAGAEPARMPEPDHLVVSIAGVDLPRLSLMGRPGEERLALAALDLFLDRATLDFDKF